MEIQTKNLQTILIKVDTEVKITINFRGTPIYEYRMNSFPFVQMKCVTVDLRVVC